ncbi:DNA-binding IclR family transcriptional regulator [Variovorax boronicumulans]|uniref:IclR family transcriptional regulator n=1 Tax=Variovorax boronicumulans TaxID=436515 RepID=UPI0024755D5E|nr:IclR family transcriptional regulator [Variovorax boronicumulans]MDH6164943.1 DNA-binding IclR family transcriptional regulator [Variovorax boronicumulans]
MSSSEARGTQSIDRTFGVLKQVVAHGSHGLTVAELVTICELERPTVHRIVQALERQGMLKRPTGSKRYVLGDYCRQMAAAFADRADLRTVCEPVLRAVSEETGNSAFLIGRVGYESICLARVVGSYPVQVLTVNVGTRNPLGVGAGGLAILSTLPLAEQGECIRANAKRLSGYGSLTESTLRALIRATQRRGHSVIGHYSAPGVVGIGMAMRNASGDVLGAITTSSIDSRMSRDDQAFAAMSMTKHIVQVQSSLDVL